MSESNRYQPSPAAASAQAGDASGFDFVERTKPRTFSTIIKQPLTIAAALLMVGVVALIAYLQHGAVYTELPRPEVSYELLPNKGLTEGVPIAIKINNVAVFKISDPVAGGGGASRAKEIVANVEGAIQDLIDKPGRNITLDESGPMPAIIQSLPDGTGKRLIIQLTEDDVKVSEQNDAKWLARTWAERLTDSLKVFVFAEAPQFTEGSDFGNALTTWYTTSKGDRGAISGASMAEAYANLTDDQRDALLSFPIPDREGEKPIKAAIQ